MPANLIKIADCYCRKFTSGFTLKGDTPVQNPRAMAMMKKENPTRSVRIMTEYAYQLVEKMNGIYLSEDKTTVLFYYRNSQYRRTLVDYLRYGRMFLKAIRPSQLIPTLKREKYIKSLRQKYDDYICVWFLERKLRA